MRATTVTASGDRIRWVELPGEEPAHTLGGRQQRHRRTHPGRVSVVPVPECGHNIMLDNPQGFVRATAAALAWPEGI